MYWSRDALVVKPFFFSCNDSLMGLIQACYKAPSQTKTFVHLVYGRGTIL